MGALTSNRKRADECFSLSGSSSSLNSLNFCNCSYQIETHISKKPRLSSVIQNTEKVNTSPESIISRLRRYPESTRQLRREVHAPCRVPRFGFMSRSGSEVERLFSGIRERADRMGNILRYKYEQAKKQALGSLHFVKIDKEVIDVEPEPEKEGVVSEDSSEVEIIEDGQEVRSVVSSDNNRVEEPKNWDGKALGNGDIRGSSSAMSDLTKVEHAGKMLDSLSLDRGDTYVDGVPLHKKLLDVAERSNSKLSTLKFDIDLEEAKLNSIRSLHSLKKPEEAKKLDEKEKQEEGLLWEAFVPLTGEEEKEVACAFSNTNRRKILVTHENSNIQITGEILQCLRPGAWLNDEVINVYLELLKERERREPKKFLNCHFFNTFFYKKLIGGRNGYDYKSVRRWTTQKKLGYGLIACDKIFVPIHKEVHWCLAVINKKDKKFQYLDSLGGIDSQVLKVLARYFVDEVKDKSGQDIDVSSWEQEYVEDLPEQQNGFDCGVFMIKYADFYSRGLGLHFCQDDMRYFRVRIAKEILRLTAD